MFSICTPSWNSLEYLKILFKSLNKNFKLPYEFLVHDNGSSDDTEKWIIENKINYTKSDKNLGFTGVNNVLKLAKYNYIIIVNTDMYFLPQSDSALQEQINKFKDNNIDKFTISSCLIEPLGDNPEYNIVYAGHDASTFNEAVLMGTFIKEREKSLKKSDTIQYSHPILFPRKMLEEMGYLDKTYFPGWAIDHDIAASAYKVGCRNFIMLGNSRVYHFISKTFTKLPNDVRSKHGQDIFLNKWKMSVDDFREKLGVKKPYASVKDGII